MGLAFGKDVTVQALDTDRYGRTIAEKTLPDGRSLNRELVRGGMAWWYRRYAPDDEAFEAEARAARRGLWAQADPSPPWEWRRVGQPLPGELAGKFIGNRRSRLYHRPGCKDAASMQDASRKGFDSAEAAEEAGYRTGRDSHPAGANPSSPMGTGARGEKPTPASKQGSNAPPSVR